MKKNVATLFIAFAAIFALCSVALANNYEPVPYSSLYLDGCGASLRAKGNGEMAVDVVVDSVGKADKVGIREIYVEELKDGKWYFYESLDSVDHPEFYEYNTYCYVDTIKFDGVPGRYYRVTITAYVKKGNGSDTLDHMTDKTLCT